MHAALSELWQVALQLEINPAGACQAHNGNERLANASAISLEKDGFAGCKAIVVFGVMVPEVCFLNVDDSRQADRISLL